MAQVTSSNEVPNYIRKVAVVGASGQLGTHITSELLKTGQHEITAITRLDSTSSPPHNVNTVKVDYDNHTSLVKALRGQDALVITMNAQAPRESVVKIVTAALEAEIPWILPNEWGGDYLNDQINKDTMLGDDKLAIRKSIESSGRRSAWIAVSCGFWYDYSLVTPELTFGLDIAGKQATFFDDGEFRMGYSTLRYCGQAVARLLSLPITLDESERDKGQTSLEEYRNSIVRVHAYTLSQKDMLASVLRVTADDEANWIIKYETSEFRYREGKKLLQTGDRQGYRQMLYSRMFYPSNPIRDESDYLDERLGLVQPNVDDATKWALNQNGIKTV